MKDTDDVPALRLNRARQSRLIDGEVDHTVAVGGQADSGFKAKEQKAVEDIPRIWVEVHG